MNDDTVSLFIGAVLPPLIAFFNQPRWPSWVRSLVAMITCLIAGVVAVYLRGDLLIDPGSLGKTFLLILIAAQATYAAFWRPTGTAPAIERATSPEVGPSG